MLIEIAMIYQCPKCSAKFQSDYTGVVECPNCHEHVAVRAVSRGCEWDMSRGNILHAFFQTVKMALFDPISFFSSVAGGSGWQRPWWFAVITTAFVFVVSFMYQAGFSFLGGAMDFSGFKFPMFLISGPINFFLGIVAAIFVIPVVTTVGLLIQAGIYHLCLMIVGAANKNFENTFRVVCYATAPQLLQIAPLLGAFVSAAWQLALNIIGIKVAHNTSYTKSLLAVFLPTIICCGMILMLLAAAAGGVAAAFIHKGTW